MGFGEKLKRAIRFSPMALSESDDVFGNLRGDRDGIRFTVGCGVFVVKLCGIGNYVTELRIFLDSYGNSSHQELLLSIAGFFQTIERRRTSAMSL